MSRTLQVSRKRSEQRGFATAPLGRAVRGFTLIELLVVVAIVALLLSILLPSLSLAREQAKTTKCAANLNAVGKAMHLYLAENRSTFPLSYAYPYNKNGDVDLRKQPPNREFGYVHWSWFLFDRGKVDDGSFACPSVPNRGHPRTYPGSDGSNWEQEQVDFAGNPPPNGLGDPRVEDLQASRMAYTANAAIVPRNKGKELGNIDVGLPRSNRFVRESEIETSGRTILATEFNRNWTVIRSAARAAGCRAATAR
jgi:prepilin-type N-terminal cleavage/methylation domain-containing protein